MPDRSCTLRIINHHSLFNEIFCLQQQGIYCFIRFFDSLSTNILRNVLAKYLTIIFVFFDPISNRLMFGHYLISQVPREIETAHLPTNVHLPHVCKLGKSARRITIFIWSTAGGWVVVARGSASAGGEGSCGDFDFAQTEKRSGGEDGKRKNAKNDR